MVVPNLIKGLVYPTVFIVSVIALDALLSAGVEAGLALFGLSVANLVVVSLLEVLFPLRREWAWWRDRQTINDLIHGAALSLIGPRLGEIALTSAIVTGVAAVAAASAGGLWPTHWPFWAQLALAVLIADFTEWAKHWGFHHIAPLWRIHALHHSADRMNVMKGARLHFLESSIRYATISAPLLILGASPDLLIWYAALINFAGNLNHSNLDMPMPGLVHYLVATPGNHRLHHAMDADLGRSNLSAITMLPDLLFGTFRHADKHPLTQLGIADDPIPQNLFAQFMAPFIWPVLTRRRRQTETSSPRHS